MSLTLKNVQACSLHIGHFAAVLPLHRYAQQRCM